MRDRLGTPAGGRSVSMVDPAEIIADAPPRVAVVTGVSRSIGIGAAISTGLADDGWTVVTTGWRDYDDRMSWGADREQRADIEIDLANPDAAATLLEQIFRLHGPATALVCCHCESVDSSILTTTIDSFDRHIAVNARATWLLIKAFAEQFVGPAGSGRIIALTSDHTAFNLPYGASKAAMDRIVLAAAVELAELGITANVVNPGATDTGWMDAAVDAAVRDSNLQPRIGRPTDCANLGAACLAELSVEFGEELSVDANRTSGHWRAWRPSVAAIRVSALRLARSIRSAGTLAGSFTNPARMLAARSSGVITSSSAADQIRSTSIRGTVSARLRRGQTPPSCSVGTARLRAMPDQPLERDGPTSNTILPGEGSYELAHFSHAESLSRLPSISG
jgi:3-oxoacyl-[acyl-carrier protein] reductase